MRRDQRLRAGADFERVRRDGRSWPHRLLVVFVAPGGSVVGDTRVGISTSRRIGGAVVRNRVRRRIRACVAEHAEEFARGFDVVIVARGAAVAASHAEMRKAVAALLVRAGVLGAAA